MSANTRTFLAATLLLLSACTPAVPQNNASSSVSSTSSASSTVALQLKPGFTTPTSAPVSLDHVTLDVPFSPQAPSANWDAVHEETCEEMSLIMAMHFVKGDHDDLAPEQAERELQELITWETAHQYSADVTITELSAIARTFYGLAPTVIDNVTEESIKAELAKGVPVIVPAAGRLLGNPYFSGEGPWYHMLVITGYRKTIFGTVFITNDPGTRRGHNYEYKADVLLNAIHDWTGVKEEIEQGDKRALTVVIQD